MSKSKNIFYSFGYASRGIYYGTRSQRNMQIHILFAVTVVFGGIYFHLSRIDWMLAVVAIFMVMVAELINTAIELNVDMVTKKQRPRAMLAKDVAAGAVLLASLGAIALGALIFLPHLFLLHHG